MQDMFTPSTIPDFAFVSRCVQLLVTLREQMEAVKPVLGDESSALATHFADLLLIISHGIETPSITTQERSGKPNYTQSSTKALTTG